MILHIAKNSKFIGPYIQFIKENFDISEHTFLIIEKSGKRDGLPDFESIKHISVSVIGEYLKFSKEIKSYIQKADKIILHGLFIPNLVFYLFFNKKFLEKCYWVINGGDLYYYQYDNKRLWNKFYEFFRKGVIKKIYGFVCLTQGDYTIAKKMYDTKAKEYFGMYINPVTKQYLDNIPTNSLKDSINIQIGNSADLSNNYFELLDMLEKFKDENIKIFAPLSYGDKEHAIKVKEYGEEKFGKKFVAMLNFLDPQKYAEYLGRIDILIFNHKRQQGLGNIYATVYLGKKIFIRSDISSWDFFENKLEIVLNDTLSIKNMNFKQFITYPKKELNKKKAEKKFYCEDYVKNVWKRIF